MKNKPTRATSHDVARLAGVSQPSVSRAFSPGKSISKDKKARILAAAKELNYVPNKLASSLSASRSNMIAVIVGNLSNPFYSESLQAFVSTFQGTGRQVLTFSVPDTGDSDEVVMQAIQYPVDAIVVTAASLSSKLVKLSEGLGIPIVTFNRSLGSDQIAGVLCDNRGGGRLIAETMHAAGARRFLVVRGDPEGSTSRDRVDGFRAALTERGIPPQDIEELDGASSYQTARAALHQRYSACSDEIPEAVFAVSDIMALGCADAIRIDFALAIPDDIMLAGYDGIREGQLACYNLTTIRQPINKMVRSTLELLEQPDILKSGGSIEMRVLPGEYIPGGTIPLTPRRKD